MTEDITHQGHAIEEKQPPWWCHAENVALSLVVALMALLPLIDVLLRKLGLPAIAGSSLYVQHLTLVTGALGGAIAARDDRLLSLSALTNYFKGNVKLGAGMVAGVVAIVITFFLAVAAGRFVWSEREAGGMLTNGIPIWTVQAFLPLGFLLIGVRLVWHSAPRWVGRIAVLLLAAGLAAFAHWTPISASKLLWPALGVLFVATLAGAPVFVTLGGAAVILFWAQDQTIVSLSLDHYRLVTNPALPTIPLFTLAGYFLAEGGASKRLIRVFDAFLGSVRGGPALVATLVCAFFTSFTGGSGVTILALGGLLMPILISARYPERAALGLLTSSGALGLLFPPCLPLILYAIIAKVDMKDIFLGGLLPGLLLVASTAWWGILQAPKSDTVRKPFDAAEAKRALWEAKWELLLPGVALGGLLSGLATPVEAAALTALYAYVVEVCFHRGLHWRRDAVRVITECGTLVGGILLILGVALGFTNWLIDAQVAAKAVDWATAHLHSPLTFLLMLNLFLLVVGCLMDIYSAIVVVVPLMVPLGVVFNIDPIHLGIIFLANLEVGYLTPPVGMNLFLASYRFDRPMSEVTRAILPLLGWRIVVVGTITYVPFLSTFLPKLLR